MFSEILLGNPGGGKRSLLVLVLLVFSLHKKRRPHLVYPANAQQKQQQRIYRMLIGCIMCCCILIPLDLQIRGGEKVVTKFIPRIQIVMDVSLSMAADDVAPSRFALAKTYIQDIARQADGTELSLIVFSGIPLLQIPFTPDMEAFNAHIQQMELADFPPTVDFLGTAMGDALLLALDSIRSASTSGGHIILLTDGDSSVGLDPLEVIGTAVDEGIVISPVAIGKEEYVLGLDTQDREVVAYIDIATLRTIAARTGGFFTHVLPDSGNEYPAVGAYTDMSDDIVFEDTWIRANMYLIPLLLLCTILLASFRGLTIYALTRFLKK